MTPQARACLELQTRFIEALPSETRVELDEHAEDGMNVVVYMHGQVGHWVYKPSNIHDHVYAYAMDEAGEVRWMLEAFPDAVEGLLYDEFEHVTA